MCENLKKFLEQVSKDETLKQKVLDCNEMEKEDAIRASIALAKEMGIELTEADFAVKEANNELADDELDAVVGGGNFGSDYGLDCNCSGAGGGNGCYCNEVGAGYDAETLENYRCLCYTNGQGGSDDWYNDTNCSCSNPGQGSN
ncbi:MAG: Nif11-like leader peptide family RiPP precursor [Lachnospiraceae bacterium]